MGTNPGAQVDLSGQAWVQLFERECQSSCILVSPCAFTLLSSLKVSVSEEQFQTRIMPKMLVILAVWLILDVDLCLCFHQLRKLNEWIFSVVQNLGWILDPISQGNGMVKSTSSGATLLEYRSQFCCWKALWPQASCLNWFMPQFPHL